VLPGQKPTVGLVSCAALEAVSFFAEHGPPSAGKLIKVGFLAFLIHCLGYTLRDQCHRGLKLVVTPRERAQP